MALNTFRKRNNGYMEKYFPAWENRGSYIIPPMPYSKYPEPREGRTSDLVRSAADYDYTRMRMDQKSEIDEGTVYRRLEKFAVENRRRMFIFHTINFEVDQQEVFINTFGQDAVEDAIRSLNPKNILYDARTLMYLEMDFLVADKEVGLVAIEVKGKDFRWQSGDRSDVDWKIQEAKVQLQKDNEFLRLIGYLSDNETNQMTKLNKWKDMPITKVVVLADDIGEARPEVDDQQARPQDRKVLVVFRNQLESATEFQQWWRANVEGRAPPNPDDVALNATIYEHMVPVLVGLSVAFNSLRSIDDIHDRDEQISRQDLSSRPNPIKLLTNVHKNEVELKDFVLKYLTPDQQDCYRESSSVCIIEGAAGTGKTLVMMLKLLEVARQERETLLLCNGPFVEEYYDFLTKNRISARIYRSIDKVQELFDIGNSKVSVYSETNPFDKHKEPYQVVLCDLEHFVSAPSKVRCNWFKGGRPLGWNQRLNVFIDDVDLKIFHKYNWDGLLTDINRKKYGRNFFYTWIALDHTQTMSAYDPSNAKKYTDLLKKLRKRVEELKGKWHKLEKVLRNSVEIIELNKQVAKYISTFHHVPNAPIPAVGHNRVSGHIQLMELYDFNLYDVRFWDAAAGSVERECDNALAKFLEFVLTNVVLPTANRCRTAVLTVGETSFATTFRSHLERQRNFEQLENRIIVYTDRCRNLRELKLDDPGNAKSFEWEQVVVVIAPQVSLPLEEKLKLQKLPEAQRLQEAERLQEKQRSHFWCNLYQATTRARTRLYLVGPPVLWDVFLKPLGVDELYFLRRCFIPKERNQEKDEEEEPMPNLGPYEQVEERLLRLSADHEVRADELLVDAPNRELLKKLRQELEKEYRVPGPIHLMKLDDATFQSDMASEEDRWEALAKFVSFLLEKKYVTNVDSKGTAVLTVSGNFHCTFWEYLKGQSDNGSVAQRNIGQRAQRIIEQLAQLVVDAGHHRNFNELLEYLNPHSSTSAATTTQPPSFKWEPLVVMVPSQVALPQHWLEARQLLERQEEPQQLSEGDAAQWQQLQDAQRSIWNELYEAQTRVQARLYLIGSSVVWNALERLSPPKQFVLRRCFEPDDRGSYKQVLEQPTDHPPAADPPQTHVTRDYQGAHTQATSGPFESQEQAVSISEHVQASSDQSAVVSLPEVMQQTSGADTANQADAVSPSTIGTKRPGGLQRGSEHPQNSSDDESAAKKSKSPIDELICISATDV